MTRFTHDGCDFNFEIRGEGPRTLLFNGSGASIESSAPLINALAKTMQVLVHDQRGLGESSVPDGPYSMAQYASDGRALLAHVGWERCNVVGISFGGMVAQEFAVTHPGVVEKLVLLCTSAGGAAGSSYPLHELGALPADVRLARQMELTDSRFVDEEWLAAHPVEAAIVAGMRDRADVAKSEERLRGERMQLEARIHHDVADRLGRVTAPTFVLAGRYDGIAPVANSEQIVARIPDSSMQVYEGGHLFSGQDRNAILDIRRFVETGERPAR
jgi:pimeloyl-ACP methyl ester carboxylesterase